MVSSECRGEFSVGYFKNKSIIYTFRRVPETLAGPNPLK